MIVGQILILRKNFKLIQLLQIPLSFLFGYFTDFGMWLVSFLKIDSYIMELLLVIVGTIIIGFGVFLAVVANVIMNSAEAFIKAVSDTTNKRFGNVKIAFDLSCVVIAVLLSVLFLISQLRGQERERLLQEYLRDLS